MPAEGSPAPETDPSRPVPSIGRLIAVALLALSLAPGLWLRSEAQWPD
jgi:hypothetical protein